MEWRPSARSSSISGWTPPSVGRWPGGSASSRWAWTSGTTCSATGATQRASTSPTSLTSSCCAASAGAM
eukprot:10057246-Alexandrium_andersonii.AAC.1